MNICHIDEDFGLCASSVANEQNVLEASMKQGGTVTAATERVSFALSWSRCEMSLCNHCVVLKLHSPVIQQLSNTSTGSSGGKWNPDRPPCAIFQNMTTAVC